MNKKTRRFLSLLGIAALVIISIRGYSVKANTDIKHWNDKFYPGIYIEDIDVSGRTKEEARGLIEENFIQNLKDKTIKIRLGEDIEELKLEELNPVFDVEGAINSAYSYGKSGNFINKFIKMKRGKKVYYKIQYKIDKTKIKKFVGILKNQIDYPAENAKIIRKNGNFQLMKESDGKMLETEKLIIDIERVANNIGKDNTVIKGVIKEIKPNIVEEQLADIDTKLSSFSTIFSISNIGRAANIALATKGLNGVVILPGEEFSFNRLLGDRTTSKGYQSAGVIVGDRLEQGIGGGICQVSTTLYNAVVKLNLRITERHNHSLPIHYVPMGTDAAVSYGSLDLRFINTLRFPIYIEGIVNGGCIQFNIYSNSLAIDKNTSYTLSSEILKVIPPDITYIEDENLLPGESEIISNGSEGYYTVTYINKVVNGKAVSKKLLYKDTYYAASTKIAVGKE